MIEIESRTANNSSSLNRVYELLNVSKDGRVEPVTVDLSFISAE